jgi:hypothetical protein
MFIQNNKFVKHDLVIKTNNYIDAKIVGVQVIEQNNVKFKIKEGNKIKTHDTRLNEKGIVCMFKSKDELNNIMNILNINTTSKKKYVSCDAIEQVLRENEAIERKNNTNVKWFYYISSNEN